MNLPEFSVNRPVTVMMACSVAILLGAIAFVQIPVDLMPETTYPTLSIRAEYQGVAPEEMETLVVRQLEEAFAAAPNVEEMVSTVMEGSAYVRLRFAYGVDMDEAANDLRSRLDRRRRYMPEDMEPPTMYKYDSSNYPIMYLTVSADDMDPKQLRHFVEKQIQYRLERVPGVAAFTVRGGLRREIHVDLDLKKLRALDLPIARVTQVVAQENVNRPVGPMDEGRFEVLLRTQGEYQSLDQIRDLVVTTRGTIPVYLRDIAQVTDGHEEVDYLVSVDGKSGVRLYVYKQSGANTVHVSDALWEEVDRIHEDYSNVYIDKTRDSADFIRASIANLQRATVQGGGLAVLVLFFFLRSFSSTMIIGIAIPISVISTFALMYFNGFTLNTVSFGGLALGVGMLVDNAIVVLENIYRYREGGASRKEAALKGSREVAMAITASTLTTIAVFVPVLFIGGMSAEQFKQLAYVVSFALLCSLLIALTAVPAMCARFLAGKGPGDGHSWLGDRYASVIDWALSHRALVVLSAVFLFAGAMYTAPLIGVELQPEVDEGEIRVNVELEPGTRVELTESLMQRLYRIADESVPEILTVMVSSGGGSSSSVSGGHVGEMRIILKDQAERTRTAKEVASDLRPKLQVRPGMMIRTRISSGMFRSSRGGNDDGDRLAIEVRGHDMDVAKIYAEQIRNAMMTVDGVEEAQVSQKPGSPEMLVTVDRPRAGSLGLNVSDIAASLETAIGGRRTSMYREDGDEYNILVRLREEDRLLLSQVGQVPLATPVGRTVSADSVVKLKRQEGPAYISRVDQERRIYVTAAVGDRDLGSVVGDLAVVLRQIPRPEGFDITFGGEYQEQQEAFRELTFAAILALLLVYMVMASQFESLRDPFIILFSVPLAAIGVVLMLYVTETTFNMQGFLGLIVLVGIVVNNAIVLVDYTNLLIREQGMELREAVMTAGSRRLRPILMTTITTVLGLGPMALGLGEGAELQAPMARVVIGGLTTSTLITLVFIPVVFYTLESWRRREPKAVEAMEPAPTGTSGD